MTEAKERMRRRQGEELELVQRADSLIEQLDDVVKRLNKILTGEAHDDGSK